MYGKLERVAPLPEYQFFEPKRTSLAEPCGCILLYAAACCSNVAAAGQAEMRLDRRDLK
jgi:hypothetical protein